jgi:hypothetical protein
MKAFVLIMLFSVLSTECLNAQGQIEASFWTGYKYDGKTIRPKQLKKLILSIEDSVASKYYSNYETGMRVFVASELLGVGLFIAGFAVGLSDAFFPSEEQDRGAIMVGTGFALMGVGLVSMPLAFKSLKNSVDRYNSLQQPSSLDLVITPNGVGMIFRF